MYADYIYDGSNYVENNNHNKKKKIINYILIGLIVIALILLIIVIVFPKKEDKPDKNEEIDTEEKLDIDSSVKEIVFKEKIVTLKEKETSKLEVTVIPNNYDSKLTWSSENDNIIVDANGGIVAIKAGSSIVTVKSSNGISATCLVVVEKQAAEVKKIKLNLTNKELVVKENFQLTATSDNGDKVSNITWQSSNPLVASVVNGKVIALKSGSTDIIAVTNDGQKAICKVTVKEEPKPEEVLATGISLNITNAIVKSGDVVSINATITPNNTTNKKITWTSSDNNLATVVNGKVTALKEGVVIITAKTSNSKAATCIITIDNTVEVNSLSLDKKSISLYEGDKTKLNVIVNPSNATNKNVTWFSSTPSIATVDSNGNIVAKGVGTTTITVRSNNNKTATCTVKVNKYAINLKTFEQRNKAVLYYYNESNKDIRGTYKKQGCNDKSNLCDTPNIYIPNVANNVKLYIYNESNHTKTYLKTINKNMAQYNMIPNVIYYLEDENNPNNNEYIKLLGSLRMIKVDGTRNVRDIGGFVANGGTIKYGKLFRGADPNHSGIDSATTKIFQNLNIDIIYDLREKRSFNKVKKYLTAFTKMNSDTGYYLNTKVSNTRKSVSQIMEQVVNKKVVYFHCAIGTDRTGTVAYLLEGILGVPLETRLDDYELSYFYKHVDKTNRNGSTIISLYKKIKKYDGNNDQEKFINWFLSDSSNKQADLNLINNFRKEIIDGNPTLFKLQNNKCTPA